MGIKRSKAIYVSDRGDSYYVEDMENSHLANTIKHIAQKMVALENSNIEYEDVLTEAEKVAIENHVSCLKNDQLTLIRELARRESCATEC